MCTVPLEVWLLRSTHSSSQQVPYLRPFLCGVLPSILPAPFSPSFCLFLLPRPPPLSYPNIKYIVGSVIQDSFVIAVVTFAVSVSLAQVFAKKTDHQISSNQVSPLHFSSWHQDSAGGQGVSFPFVGGGVCVCVCGGGSSYMYIHRCMSGMHVCTVYLHVGQYVVCLQVLTCLIQYNVLTYVT